MSPCGMLVLTEGLSTDRTFKLRTYKKVSWHDFPRAITVIPRNILGGLPCGHNLSDVFSVTACEDTLLDLGEQDHLDSGGVCSCQRLEQDEDAPRIVSCSQVLLQARYLLVERRWLLPLGHWQAVAPAFLGRNSGVTGEQPSPIPSQH